VRHSLALLGEAHGDHPLVSATHGNDIAFERNPPWYRGPGTRALEESYQHFQKFAGEGSAGDPVVSPSGKGVVEFVSAQCSSA
jgi:hypothetical protein